MFVILIFSEPNFVYSQSETIDIHQYISESNREWSEEEIHEIEELLLTPIPLNSLSFEEYSIFFFLTEFQKKSLFDFVQKNKPLRTIYELQFVLGFTQETAKMVASICTLEHSQTTKTLRELIHSGKHTVSLFNSWLPVSTDSYTTHMKYPGKPLKSSYKYRFQSFDKLYWGIQLKNDMGEPTQHGMVSPQYDFASAYIQLRDYKRISNIVIGDYQASIGQGLALRQGGFFAKSMGFSPMISGSILKRHTSSNEFLFNRGIGMSYALKKTIISPFISRKNIDGSVNTNDSLSPFQIYTTGLHRTPHELYYKKKLIHSVYGINSETRIGKFTYGTAYIRQTISNKTTSVDFQNLSLHYSYFGTRTSLYGETAFNKTLHMAYIHGIQHAFSQQIEGQASIRSYDASYTSCMAQSFQEQSNTQNEQGLYLLLRAQITGSITLTSAHDRFRRPTAIADKPEMYGNESSLSIKYSKYRSHSIEYRMGYETKTEKIENQWYAAQTATNIRHKHMVRFQYQYAKLEFRTVFMKAFAQQTGEHFSGFYLGQDIIYKPTKNVQLYIRYAEFNAPYNTRMYVYEHAIQNAYTMPQILYSGTQWLCVAKCKLSNSFNVEFQANKLKYYNAQELPEYYSMFGTNQKIHYACIIQYSL